MADTARVAAELLDVPWEKCEVVWGNTGKHVPWSSGQWGSQTIHAHTRANYVAALDAKRKLQEIAARDLGGTPEDFEVGDERVFLRADPASGLSFERAARRAIELGGPYDGHELSDELNEMTTQSAGALAGQGLMGVAKDTPAARGSDLFLCGRLCPRSRSMSRPVRSRSSTTLPPPTAGW